MSLENENQDLLKSLDRIEANIKDVQKDFSENKISQKALADEVKKLGDEQVKYAQQLQEVAQSVDASKKAFNEKEQGMLSVGELAAKNEAVKNYQAGTVSFEVSTKADTIHTSGAANSVSRTTVTAPYYRSGMVTMPDQPLQIEDLFPHIPVTVDAIEYLKEGTFTDGSAVTAEGSKLGETKFNKPSLATANCVNIGAYSVVTHQLITNEQAFAAYVNSKMQYKLQLNVENQLINGTGSGQLGGLLKAGNYTDKTADARQGLPASEANLFDLALLLKNEFEKQYIVPENFILNPNDWVGLCLLKDKKGNYILGGPQSLATKTLWGVPVLTSPLVASGKYILGNFTLGATIYDREALNFRISDQDGENFKSMLYTLRVNRRLGFAVENPLAIFAGDWSLAAEG